MTSRASQRRESRSQAPPPPDPDAGMWQGRSIARRLESPDGFVVLVGRTASDNDLLSLKLASPRDFWLHVAGQPGSHVVVRNPDNLSRLPRETLRFAACLAAGYSKAKAGGKVAVHVTRCSEVSKPRGYAAGKVTLARFETVQARPLQQEDLSTP